MVKSKNEITINEICQRFIATVKQPDGSFRLDDSARAHTLIAGGIRFHLLSIDEIFTAVVCLSQTMSAIGLRGAVITEDHFHLWGWCAEIILSPEHVQQKNDAAAARLNRQLFEAIFSIIFMDRTLIRRFTTRLKPSEFFAANIVFRGIHVLRYLTFPLLEILLKMRNAQSVSPDGTVIQSFAVLTSAGKQRVYKNGTRCNSQGDLLTLTRQSASTSSLTDAIDRLEAHFNVFDGRRLQDQLYEWRNATVHADPESIGIYATTLNISILFALDAIRDRYTNIQHSVMKDIERRSVATQTRAYYYPPLV